MGGFSYARIISSGQRCAPVLLIFLKAEGQLLVLLTFLPTWEHFSVTVVEVSEESAQFSAHLVDKFSAHFYLPQFQ